MPKINLSEKHQQLLSSFGVAIESVEVKEIWRQLAAFWVFGTFHKGQSDLSGKRIITPLPEKVPFPIYSYDEWKSDAWDAIITGLSNRLRQLFRGGRRGVCDNPTRSGPTGSVTIPIFSIPAFLTPSMTCTTTP